MAYKTLRKIFHEGKIDPKEELKARLSNAATIILPFSFTKEKLFYTKTGEIYDCLLKIEKLDKELTKLVPKMPALAVVDFSENSLIEEIILTNKIEGVNSSKKEISDAIESLKTKRKNLRFQGLVKNYQLLTSQQNVELKKPIDIRALYDDMVYEEVLLENKNNKLDGEMFRKNGVDVYSPSGKSIHSGVLPEADIIKYLQKSLKYLNNDDENALIKAAIFHYLFAYIHPFYDGNGRINRFISSCVISGELSYLVALRLSYVVHKNLEKYYAAFTACQHPLNHGDLTPFVLAFCDIVLKAVDDIFIRLKEQMYSLELYKERLLKAMCDCDENQKKIAEQILISTLFSAYGITPRQLAEDFNISRQTVYTRVAVIKEIELLEQKKIGKKTYYVINVDKL